MAKFDIWMFFARREFASKREYIYESIGNSMVKDGISINDCVRKLALRAEKDKRPIAKIYKGWIKRMGDTATRGEFTAAIKRDIPDGDYMVLSGFERANNLGEGILYLASVIKRTKALRKMIKSSLASPIVSLFAMLGLSIMFVAPSKGFSQLAAPERWPKATQVMFTWTDFVDQNILLVMMSIVAFGILLAWSMPNWSQRGWKVRRKLDQFFPYSMYKDYSSFQALIVLSALLSSGVPIKAACQSIMETGTPWLRAYFKIIVRRLGDAKITQQAMAFDVGFLPKEIFYRLLDSSERNDVGESLKRIANDAFEDVENNIRGKIGILNQLTTFVSGGIAVTLALGLVSAVGQIQTILRH